jgi:hypothetical protein
MIGATAAELGFCLKMNRNRWPFVRIEHSFSPQALQTRVAELQAGGRGARVAMNLVGDWAIYEKIGAKGEVVVAHGMFKG